MKKFNKPILKQAKAGTSEFTSTTTRAFLNALKNPNVPLIRYQKQRKQFIAKGLSGKELKDATRETKELIPCVAFSGMPVQGGARKNVDYDPQSSTGIFLIDIDDLVGNADVKRVRGIVEDIPSCLFAFNSPSGNGVKAGFNVGEVKSDDEFKAWFYKFEYYFKTEHGITIDPNCKDIFRLCFLSYDPSCYVNEDAEIAELDDVPENSCFADIDAIGGSGKWSREEWSLERIEPYVNPISSDDRDDWTTVGMALKETYGDDGFNLWNEWSKKSSKYTRFEADKAWKSFVNGKDRAKNIGSIIAIYNRLPKSAQTATAKAATNTKHALNDNEPKWVDFTITKNGQKLHPTRKNLQAIIDFHGLELSWDVILLKENISGFDFLQGHEGESLIAELKDKCTQYGLYDTVVDKQLDAIIYSKPINPVTDWLKSTKRTKTTNPMTELVDMLPVENKEWTEISLNRWFIQCCASADNAQLTPNKDAFAKFESVLVFSGTQGFKKTSFVKYLLPKKLHKYTQDSVILDMKDKDSVVKTLSSWIPELGELDATFDKSSNAALKGFLSNTEDIIRLPFQRKPTNIRRRSSCTATVNKESYLRDATGNRRYFPIAVTGDFTCIRYRFDYADLWAYAWELYISGEQWWLTPEEEEVQKVILAKHEDKSPRIHIADTFDFSEYEPDDEENVCVSLEEILTTSGLQINPANKTRAGIYLKQQNVPKPKKIKKDGVRKHYYDMPKLHVK